MSQTPFSVEQLVLQTLAKLEASPELTKDEVAWFEQFSVRLLAEFNSAHEESLPAEMVER